MSEHRAFFLVEMRTCVSDYAQNLERRLEGALKVWDKSEASAWDSITAPGGIKLAPLSNTEI